MRQYIKRRIQACETCQKIKCYPNNMNPEFVMVRSEYVNDLVSVDLYGPLPKSRGGVQYLLVTVDVFSKLVRLYPLKKATAKAVINRMIQNRFQELGIPQRILSDHGTQFTSGLWVEQMQERGVKVVYSSIRHPQSNPVERIMRELGRSFRATCSDNHSSWAMSVKAIEDALNSCVHSSTGCSPNGLHFGKPLDNEIKKLITFPEAEAIDHVIMQDRAARQMDIQFQKRQKLPHTVSKIQFQEGDLVLLRVPHLSSAVDGVTQKFCKLYEGPYAIHKRLDNGSYILALDGKIKDTFHHQHLRPFYRR